MRLAGLVFALACLLCLVFAWDKEDYEIFDLQEALEKAEGKGTTFYSWLDVTSTATNNEIAKAYRKKSLEMHPDKNPGVKGIQDRYARLGVIQKILRSEGRERYDFFYKNGFPRWRGTGYYYSRFRPGLGTVLVFLVLVTAGMQHMVQRMNYKRDIARIERFVNEARRQAWGPKLNKVEGRRKVRINLGASPVQYDEDGNEIGGGGGGGGGNRYLEMVVEGDNVFIVEGDGELIPLDTSAATYPTWKTTWPATLAASLVARVTGKRAAPEAAGNGADEEDETESEAPASGYTTPSGGKAQPAVKAGGSRRRKPGRK
ncbi:hypothetical protein EXIGLDRAFT_758512 [Exidia glandulosa HHB12029]|uniref:J domain-containing protein n=1 Tax=Exidia glandulosa HHB12029 TaxID=1314781 RepID=A0A165QXS8_EXIGL|nr:hypothetical protein EXIGLDRAFT_758512 [Exidia glandulosa HHB12029]